MPTCVPACLTTRRVTAVPTHLALQPFRRHIHVFAYAVVADDGAGVVALCCDVLMRCCVVVAGRCLLSTSPIPRDS